MAREKIKFEKVSYEQFKNSVKEILIYEEAIKEAYDNIKLPVRSTSGSAGYDFYSPFGFILGYKNNIIIPTGIKASMPNDAVLCIFPRSGQGFKTGISLANTVGVIDSDYYYSDNEGHIMVKLTNNNSTIKKDLTVEKGQAFCQGIFLPFLRTVDDAAETKRNGGFGSTDQ